METALHGREQPLRALREAYANAHAGRGQLVLLAGEAGIGKSALASELSREASSRGAAVSWGRAWEFAEAPPYFPLRPCLLSVGVPAELPDESRAFELWERVLASLARASERQTLVWIVDDVHAADLGTLDLLTFLVQPLRAMRVLVVATLRPHDARLDERKLQRLARMARDGLEVRLESLRDDAIAAIAREALGRDLPDATLRRLAELTGGNPLFVVECVRALRSGSVEHILERIPPTVMQVVLERVGLLPEATRRALEAAAVLGREVSAASVARMRDSQPTRIIDELLPALRAGVLRESRAGHFTFSHVLVRDAIENAIPEGPRADLHARAEAALAELGDGPEILVERARHALAAARAGEPTRALAIARRATDLLERERAFDRAFELHEKLLEAHRSGFLPRMSPDEKLHVARVARDAGRESVMRRLCDEVIAEAREADDAVLFAHAVLLHATSIRPNVIDGRQVALLEEARARISDRPLAHVVLARLATALQPADDFSRPNELAREARRGALATGDDALILDVMHVGELGMYGAPIAECIAWSEELRDRALRAGDLSKALAASSHLAMWFGECGRFDAYAEAVTATLALADRASHPRDRWDALLLASGYACALGHYEESERYTTEVTQIAALVDDPALGLARLMHEIVRAKLRGDRDELLAALANLDAVMREVKHGAGLARAIRAACSARLGDLADARLHLDAIGAQARVLADLDGLTWLAEAYVLAGTDAERTWVRDALDRLPQQEVFGGGVTYIYEGPKDLLLGRLDAALGDLEAAEARLRRAYELARARGLAPLVAETARALAAVLERRGRSSAELADAAAPTPAPAVHAAETLRMTLVGDVWTAEWGTRTARIKDSRGAQLLARLIDRPGEDIHVLALASDDGASVPESSAGDQLDDRARKAYRKRLADLDEAIAGAEGRGDAVAANRLAREKDALVKELARAAGLGGRSRQAGSATERARVNVQRRVKEAIARLVEADAELGGFVERSVRTGTYCCFRP